MPKEISQIQIRQILEAAITAPSADNSQPWAFRQLESGFELWIDLKHIGNIHDPAFVATKISCGALTENVVTFAKSLGFDTSIHFFKESEAFIGNSPFAQFHFSIALAKANSEISGELLHARCTNRNLFRFGQSLNPSSWDQLKKSVEASSQYRLIDHSSNPARKIITEILIKADQLRYSNQEMYSNFYKCLHFGNSGKELRDGLAANTLGLEFYLLPILKLLKSWTLMRILFFFGFSQIFKIRGTWLPLKFSSGIISIVHRGPANYTDFGRVIERFWLLATKEDLQVQPLGLLPLCLARYQLENGKGFSSEELEKIGYFHKQYEKATAHFSTETDQIVMMFRLGYSKKSPCRSYRRTIESFMIKQIL